MLGTREQIIIDERYHTCGRCKWGGLSYEMYPCNQCIHGLDMRKDFWEYALSEIENCRVYNASFDDAKMIFLANETEGSETNADSD